MPDQLPSATDAPDENALVLPESWLSLLHPRRGGVPVPEITVSATAAEGMAARTGGRDEELARVLEDPDQDPELAGRARAYLGGTPDPVGAAVVATALPPRPRGGASGLLDTWTTAHGLAFSACAFAEMNVMAVVMERIDSRPAVRSVRYRRPDDGWPLWATGLRDGRRLRGLLAQAGDREYAEAVERLAAHRRTPVQRVVVSYLVPAREDWVEECCAAPPAVRGEEARFWGMLLCALGSARQVDLLRSAPPQWALRSDHGMLATVLEGLGPAAAPLVDAVIDRPNQRADDRKAALEALALLPSDEAFGLLIERIEHRHVPPVLIGAMDRFPVRALRLLGAAAAGASKAAGIARDLLSAHVAAHPDLVARVLDELPAEARGTVKSLDDALRQVREARAEDLPEFLITPPWERPKAAGKASKNGGAEAERPIVTEGLREPVGAAMNWAPGEREAWAGLSAVHRRELSRGEWEERFERLRAGTLAWYDMIPAFRDGPEDLARPLLAGWRPERGHHDMRPVMARFEAAALPAALHAAREQPGKRGALLLPFLSADAALLAAQWLTHPKAARGIASEWFGRQGVDAVPYLVPAALGEHGAARDALRLLADRHGALAVVTAAKANGDQAAAAIEALLAEDPLELVPAQIPKPGAWADPVRLPRVLLLDRRHALPPAATRHLLTMMAMSEYERVYAGLSALKDLCDPGSLADFSWAVFRWWRLNGGPSKDGWALTQLGVFGDDGTVRRLAPVIRDWPGEGGHKLAEKGLDVLAAIGTEVALMHLHGIALKVKFKGLKARARAKVESIAADLGLSAEQLGDRLVPTLGLDASGGLPLDYGPRRFTVGFDEALKPYVTDESGKRRKALPKPGAKDDAELAGAAYTRFADLRKDVRTVAAGQVGRLESAMVDRRRWTAAEFGTYFAGHPLVWHIARRLVWIAEDAGTVTAFRIAEDRTYAGVEDQAYTLPDSAEVWIAHPIDLGEGLDAWGQVFADYEILQPFPQLDRTVHALTDGERAAGNLERFEGLEVPSGAVVRLERLGWERGTPGDGGSQSHTARPVPGGLFVIIDLDPGISIGEIDGIPEQTLDRVWIHHSHERHRYSTGPWHTFGELDPLTASEVLAQLTELAATAR